MALAATPTLSKASCKGEGKRSCFSRRFNATVILSFIARKVPAVMRFRDGYQTRSALEGSVRKGELAIRVLRIEIPAFGSDTLVSSECSPHEETLKESR